MTSRVTLQTVELHNIPRLQGATNLFVASNWSESSAKLMSSSDKDLSEHCLALMASAVSAGPAVKRARVGEHRAAVMAAETVPSAAPTQALPALTEQEDGDLTTGLNGLLDQHGVASTM
mmetsp:Transcript_45640/g.108670  ORF Transcript_45640/g.108670 Transcript_45640/m.108670 type:complete len:119 (-) Transcript_45640:159-515(-)